MFIDGAVYHVYNRLARGEQAFGEADVAQAFVDLLREVMSRDQVRVFAWALMPNHYHLAVQTGGISARTVLPVFPVVRPRPSGPPVGVPARRIPLKGSMVGTGEGIALEENGLGGLRRWLRLCR